MLILSSVLFFICPVMSIPVSIIALVRDKKYRKIYGLFLAISLAIIMFHLDLSGLNIDLKVYYGQINTFKWMKIDELYKVLITQKEPITNFLFYLISKTGIDAIWQFLTTTINYFIMFYILSDYAKIKQIGNKSYAIILIIAITFINNIFLLTGIRNTLALMVYILILYNEYVKQRKNKIYKLLYIIPVLIHMSMIIGIIVRILMNIDIKKYKHVLLIGLIIYAFSPNLIVQVSNFIGNISIFSDLVIKVQNYILLDEIININSIVRMVSLLYMFTCFYQIQKKREKENLETTNLYRATEIFLLFNIFSFNYWDIFLRWFDVSVIMFCLILIDNVKNIKISKKISTLIMVAIISMLSYIQISSLQELNVFKGIDEYCYKNIVTVFSSKDNEG